MLENTSDAGNISRCSSYDIPSISAYLSATNKYGIILVSLSSVALLIVLIMFIDTLHYIMKNSSSRVKTHSAFVIGVYPVTALVSYFAILVPRAHLLAEAITQGTFMAGMYQLFCLFMAYGGGEAEIVKKVQPKKLILNVRPCCCWPCCCCLPVLDVTKKTLGLLRLLVLQLPVVQGLVYSIFLVMWAERESLYQVNYMYLQPLIFISIMTGIWGMVMTINLLKDTMCSDFLLVGKFFVLQMVLVLAKLQGLFTRALVWTDMLPCKPPITPQVYANLIHNVLMITEMTILGAIARNLYKRIIQHTDVPFRISTIGSIMCANSKEFKDCDNNCNTVVSELKFKAPAVNVISGYDNLGLEIKC